MIASDTFRGGQSAYQSGYAVEHILAAGLVLSAGSCIDRAMKLNKDALIGSFLPGERLIFGNQQ